LTIGTVTLGTADGFTYLQPNGVGSGNSAVDCSFVLGNRGDVLGTDANFVVTDNGGNGTLTYTPRGDLLSVGNLKFGTYTASAVAQTGYITVTDSDGTTRRLLVG
jgi:hypothetical protein